MHACTLSKNSAVLTLGVRFADIEITATLPTCNSVSEIRPRPAADSKAHHIHPQNPHELRGRGKSLRGRWLNWRGSTGLQLANACGCLLANHSSLHGLDEWMDGASLISRTGFCRGARPAPRFMPRRRTVSSQLGPHLPDCRASSAKRPPKSCQDPWRLA